MNETLAVWERIKKRFGIKSETKPKPETVVRPMDPTIAAALKGKTTLPPTKEVAQPIPTDGRYIVSGPTAKG